MTTDISPAVDLADAVRELARTPVSAAARATSRVRLADTALATLIGRHTPQGRSSAALSRQLYGARSAAARAFTLTAACRLTEIDDVDLISCTTPGSVVIPTVLAVLSARPDASGSLEHVLDTIARGYEIVVGLGELISGPRLIGIGVWPTLALGAVAAAAVTSALLEADAAEIEAATVLAAQQSIDGNPRGNARETLLATAVVVGIGSALAVRRGFSVAGGRGTGALPALLPDKRTGALVSTDAQRLFRPAVKGFCSARQAMTSVTAMRELMAEHDIRAGTIDRIEVTVPTEYAAMLTKPTVTSRRESLASAAYQLALTVLAPDELLDVARTRLHTEEPFRALMAAVHVRGSAELSRQYPEQWPARVEVRAQGRSFSAAADEVPGESVHTVEALDAKFGLFLDGPDRPEGLSVDRIRTWSLYSSGITELRELATVIDGESAEGVGDAHVRISG